VFFGGGTPSLLDSQHVEQILNGIRENYVLTEDAEITLEANPNDITRNYTQSLHQAGINRLSLGVQSANSNELKLFARRHDNDEVAQAVAAARNAGFRSLNIDLIYGIPHQTLDSWRWTLDQIGALQPDHLSLYALGLETGTPMNDWVQQGQLPLPDDDLAADMYELATDNLADKGYRQYEISNWARPSHDCRHNLQYWRNLPYLGFGPGAHGYAGGVRYWTILSPQRYIKVMENAEIETWTYPLTPATDESVNVDLNDEISETLIMGLRLTQEGINRSTFTVRFEQDLLDIHKPTIERFEALGLLEVNSQQVRLTRKGRLLSNAIFRELV
jgi:oxygen-independent coproporphyrinogen-3 oxidase